MSGRNCTVYSSKKRWKRICFGIKLEICTFFHSSPWSASSACQCGLLKKKKKNIVALTMRRLGRLSILALSIYYTKLTSFAFIFFTWQSWKGQNLPSPLPPPRWNQPHPDSLHSSLSVKLKFIDPKIKTSREIFDAASKKCMHGHNKNVTGVICAEDLVTRSVCRHWAKMAVTEWGATERL